MNIILGKIDSSLFYRSPERNFTMSEKTPASEIIFEHGQINPLTYKEQAYRVIKEAILYQKFQPDAVYSQEGLCQNLGISRTPVREALLELQKEGYVRFCRGKGIQIVSLSKDAIHDILEMRLHLEMTAAELAAKRATKADLDYISECLEGGRQKLDEPDVIRCYRLDHQFHRAVAKAAHNDLLYHSVDEVLNHYLRFEVLTVYQSDSHANSIWQEHSALCDAIWAHDPQSARRAAETHLNDAYRRTLGKYWL